MLGLELPQAVKGSVPNLLKHTYENIFKPILEVALEKGDIDRVPRQEELLEYGHVLPLSPKSSATTEPIIIRFFSRVHRTAVMKNKKAFFDNQLARTRRTQSTRRGVLIVEDLTAANLKKLMELKKDPEVDKAWTMNGKIKFVMKDKPDIVKTYRF